ncbi:MAG: GNAT family N-acetyltransferase [Gemmobacter sp.]|jgi:GNAT superfamily N-acetyltransferase|nr:GNAT family N-acetyltransferase [Gemmobacter sp.]
MTNGPDSPAAPVILAAMEATWPPARRIATGPWILREGLGGGQRVSAATAEGDWAEADIPQAEAGMAALRQERLFLIRQGEERLDAALAARGYLVKDPVVVCAAPVEVVAQPVSAMAAFPHWPPLAIAVDLWAEGGIGPDRLAVMERVGGLKAAILGRKDDSPAGSAFAAMSGPVAMLHALEVRPAMRRRGAARDMVRAAAGWAREQGAEQFAVVVTEANAPARALYRDLGMAETALYHYRVAP